MVVDRVLTLHWDDDALVEDPIEVKHMHNAHFQNIFAPYMVTDGVVAAIDACCNLQTDFTQGL